MAELQSLNYINIIEGTSLIVVKFLNDHYCVIGLKLLGILLRMK